MIILERSPWAACGGRG